MVYTDISFFSTLAHLTFYPHLLVSTTTMSNNWEATQEFPKEVTVHLGK